jgi:hypothetical protein
VCVVHCCAATCYKPLAPSDNASQLDCVFKGCNFAIFKPDTQLWALPFVSICYMQVVERYGVVQYIENSRLARLEPASCCVCWNSVEFSQLRSLLPAC